MNKNSYILTIKAEDRPGLLHLLTGVLNRKLIPVASLSAAPTAEPGIVLVTMQVLSSEKALTPLLFKLENIIEVYAVEAIPASRVNIHQTAFFWLEMNSLPLYRESVIEKWQLQTVSFNAGTVLLAKSGSPELIVMIYQALSGPHLQGFSQSGFIADSALAKKTVEEQSSVISRLAA